MRYKRTERFKKLRRKNARRVFIMAIIPVILILLGYLVASLIILPSMTSFVEVA